MFPTRSRFPTASISRPQHRGGAGLCRDSLRGGNSRGLSRGDVGRLGASRASRVDWLGERSGALSLQETGSLSSSHFESFIGFYHSLNEVCIVFGAMWVSDPSNGQVTQGEVCWFALLVLRPE